MLNRKDGRRWLGVTALAMAWAVPIQVSGQEPATLTLEEALELARTNSPDFLATRNDEGAAAWAVREAYGGFLPRASVSGGMRYEEGGASLIGSFTAQDIGFSETPAYYWSSYSADVTMSLSGETFFNVAEQRANRHAVAANVRAAEVLLEAAVKRAYVTVLRERDNVELRRQQLERAEENLTLAETRVAAGVAIPLDAKQAAVERGRAQVDALTSQSAYETAKLRLMEQIGLEFDHDIRLTTALVVFEPTWSRESLIEMATQSHPMLRSLRATTKAQRAAARTAWSSYLPTVSARAGLSGFTRQAGSDEFLVAQATSTMEQRLENCVEANDFNARLADPYPPRDCTGFVLTNEREDSLRQAVVGGNRAWPFDFQSQPLQVAIGVSVPVFQGFSRQRQVAQAQAAADDTEHRLRGERLRLRTDVAAAHLRLRTAYEAVQIEESNRGLADEQLEQARERYRVGLDSFIQLTEAETIKSEADQRYLAAVYTFHEALADLESAVGQPLRPAAP